MSANRHLGRIVALQTLYEVGFRRECSDKTLDVDDVIERNLGRYSELLEDKKFVEAMIRGTDDYADELDALLQPIAPEWPIAQIARMDRTILRMGLYELISQSDTPPKVVINESVELAKAFGAENSSKFVNGVLGTALKQKEAGTKFALKKK